MFRWLRPLVALILLDASVLLGIGDAYLANWYAQAGPHRDIAARGPVLLGMLLPLIALGTLVGSTVVLYLCASRYRLGRVALIVIPLGALALAIGGLLAGTATSVLGWRMAHGLAVTLVVDVALGLAGIALLTVLRPRRSASLAAA